MEKKDLNVALVHDFLIQYGGAERVLEVFCEMFPDAPIYTVLYDKEKMRGKFENRKIITSFFQKLPKYFRRHFKIFLPFLPVAPETFDLREYDLVISSSGAWSKGIVTRLNTTHIAYIHSPMRFVWDRNEKYLKEEKKQKIAFFIRPVLSYLRLWDYLAADRPDHIIANSCYTQARIKKYYGRESTVIYPPVTLPPQTVDMNKRKYFLIVSRLSAYKKIDMAVKAFNIMNIPLVIVGIGKQYKYLKKIAGENIKFFGFQSDEKLDRIFKRARALIFPGVDDFGLSAAEAASQGVPVIGLRHGGILEIIEEGKTGEFFDSSSSEAIIGAVNKFIEKESDYDRGYIKESAKKFGKERFKEEIKAFILRAINKLQ